MHTNRTVLGIPKTAIILAAPPGGGKTTLFEGMENFGLPCVDLPFRPILDAHVKGETDIGKEIFQYRSQGKLVPDSIMRPVIENAFASVKDANIVFCDGMPRNIEQIPLALNCMREYGFSNVLCVNIETPPHIAMRRMMERARDAQDLDLKNLEYRMGVYEVETKPMVKKLRYEAEKFGINFHLICGLNLKRNMLSVVHMLFPNMHVQQEEIADAI